MTRRSKRASVTEPQPAIGPRSLVGMFFHTDNGWQGQVIGDEGFGLLEVQLFSWVHGYPTDVLEVSIADTHRWRFHASEEIWRVAGDKLVRDLDSEEAKASTRSVERT